MNTLANTSCDSKIVIHINNKLDDQNRSQFSDGVTQLNGVVSAALQEKCPQLMIVAFNPLQTQAVEVVNGIRNKGMPAQLISWL